ncbi:tRNA (adenine(58)-N(1))-methyltransferase TrmI [Thermus oshimai]|jgi:tRNA (adenine57-N1/adenine58-N1)-methyltransferase|uniref:tRNA (adenine(58)-N(1))-methyltransferase TrmI n=1 Tax=Thermus oshimai JL-2 TaxID=751945 RepID=K7RJ01_THEOS|nr:tRNA(1-methyladenosine) methyltransferase-like methyltransferase [Thermus oshimai]AFV76387.1 tRNA(1-methyladenosine) methyltransferase-like methyltransferase [Thermus oshimai JL-2]
MDEGLFLLKDGKGRAFLVRAKPGGVFHHHRGTVPHEAILEAGPGGRVKTHLGEELSVHRPSLEEYVLHMKRSATPTYPKDASAMVALLDLAPGMRVLEAGTGSGGLTLFLARAVGPEGLVDSYEARPQHLKQAEANVRAFWPHDNVRFHLKALEEAELEGEAYHGVALDLMEPWKVLPKAALALMPDRFLVAYLPNITQVLELVKGAEGLPLRLERVLEVGWREWEIRLPVAHPRFQQVGHTAFLVVFRRWKAS